MASNALNSESLYNAFERFNQQSGIVEQSYRDLHDKLEFLTRQKRLTAIGEMTAEFAHQVRTPLASAMLYTSQLDTSTDTQRRIVARITARLNDLGRMLNDMLGFAAGDKPSSDIVDVSSMFRDIDASIGVSLSEQSVLDLLIDGSSIERPPKDLPALTLTANADALKGALINLVMNADQAAAGRVNIQLAAWRDDESVFFTVTDDGPGIADEILPRLFEPFFTTRERGTGLGLAVVQAVALAHGGEATACSLTRGSRFTLRIPLLESGAAESKPQELQADGSGDD